MSTIRTYSSNFPNRNTSDNGIAKMDYRINSKHTVNGSVVILDLHPWFQLGE